VFWRMPNFFCIGDGIGSLLEHLPLPKGQVVCGDALRYIDLGVIEFDIICPRWFVIPRGRGECGDW